MDETSFIEGTVTEDTDDRDEEREDAEDVSVIAELNVVSVGVVRAEEGKGSCS